MDQLLVKSIGSQQVLKRAISGDVGYDLEVCVQDEEKIEIPSAGFVDIPVGLSVKIPDDAWGMITGRSSTFARRQLLVMQGIIDAGYIGPLYIFVYNFGHESCPVYNGDRLAQLILIPKYETKVKYVDNLPETIRGENGFGSTGGFNGGNNKGLKLEHGSF